MENLKDLLITYFCGNSSKDSSNNKDEQFVYSLFCKIYEEILNEHKHTTFENFALVAIQCLPRHFFKFLQDCCNYVNLLKNNIEHDDKYAVVLNNFARHVTNYLVYLHGIYVVKNTPGNVKGALSIEEYYGEATFNTEADREGIFRKYFIVVNVIFDTVFRCKKNIKNL